ncbi:MAG: fimbrillin family protein [Bacteroides sp.]|nr:fimbrillin family protein [Bacteroides sp.]MCM1380190.1 fimbrillin family protein [Bacteroides sp.]MCM1446495.1 fimbrillin family protein [Prevotella sp.]
MIDARTADQTKQTEFDFLFADKGTASRTAPELEFAFKHKMSRLVLNFQTDAESGFTASDVTTGTFAISGIRHSGSFNPATGETTTTNTITNDREISATATSTSNVRTYSMIFFPQSGAKLTLTATVADQEYACEISPALAAGTSYTYTITIKKTGLEVSNATITNWTTGESANGTASAP